jgi:O-antigen/teichoic acid export membrane protein
MKSVISILLRDARLQSVADQAAVSAMNFLSFVILARLAAPEDVGIYAVSLSVVAIAIAAQEALIVKPFTINIGRPIGNSREQAFVTLCLGGLFAGGLGVAGGVIATTLAVFGMERSTIVAVLVLSAACPTFLARELARRYLLSKLRAGEALLLDACYAAGALAILALLCARGKTEASELLLLTGGLYALVTLGWLWVNRRDFSVRFQHLPASIRLFWESGKYFLGGHMALQAQAYIAAWLALTLIGKAAAGIYAACATLAGLSNPFLYGYANILIPKFVRVFNDQGASALRRQTLVESAILASVMAGFCGVIFLYAPQLMRLLYANEAYDAYAGLVRILAAAALVGSVGVAPSLALAATGNARMAASVMVGSTIVNLIFVVALLPGWGLSGAAYGLLAGEVISAVGRWTVFLRCVPAQPVLTLART